MGVRKDQIVTGEYYHIYNRSIAGYKIYNSSRDYQRFVNSIIYYLNPIPKVSLSRYLEYTPVKKAELIKFKKGKKLLDVVCYCIMPTHFHLLIKQNRDDAIATVMANIQNSYTRYFNTKHKRKGPLWESKYKNIHIESDEQLLHLTRYIHLNPFSAGIVNNISEWKWSSYNEFIEGSENICSYKYLIDLPTRKYQTFINDRKGYQKELSIIKSILMDDYNGS